MLKTKERPAGHRPPPSPPRLLLTAEWRENGDEWEAVQVHRVRPGDTVRATRGAEATTMVVASVVRGIQYTLEVVGGELLVGLDPDAYVWRLACAPGEG